MDTLPIFKSHYSIGRSILTLEDEAADESSPDSIINIAKEYNLKKVFLIEDNMSSFLQAYTNFKKYNIDLVYGVRLSLVRDMNKKDDEEKGKSSKICILYKNFKGYKKLIKLFCGAAKDGFYYEPRVDNDFLIKNWSEEDLALVIPFYDSFIFNNILKGYTCTPSLDFTKPIFFIESNELPFDKVLESKVINYCTQNKFETIKTQTIYYKNRKDFKAYLTFRCINSRTNLNKPELEHMTSDTFCLENWLNKENIKR